MQSEEFKWPPKCHISFRNGRGKLLFDSTDRDLDLSDTLMLNWNPMSRTVYMGLRTSSKNWKTWTDENIKKIEWLVRYDLNFDGYSVSVKRITEINVYCRNEFVWQLVIRTVGCHSRDEKVAGNNKRNQNPSRYRKARSDASVDSIQLTIEENYGLPSGSVKLVNPNGRKIRSDATIGTLVSNWEKNV
jgi:hypothetical protein